MQADLPVDLLAFLAEGRQLDFDSTGTSIGSLRLKSLCDVSLSTIRCNRASRIYVHDPYLNLQGNYEFRVYDLVSVSDDYSPVGLLCWFVDLKVFGCIDPEHGKVMTFPDSTWSDIVASPIAYLDERWDGTGLGENIFPWLYFPFVLEDNSETKLLPYRHQCPMHELAITTMRRPRQRIFESFRRRETASWLHNYQKTFPCSGLPINENDDQLACIACREAEDNWLREVIAAITPVDAQLYGQNWVKCPACGVRFSTVNPDSYLEDIHLRCGQRLRLQFPK